MRSDEGNALFATVGYKRIFFISAVGFAVMYSGGIFVTRKMLSSQKNRFGVKSFGGTCQFYFLDSKISINSLVKFLCKRIFFFELLTFFA